MTVSHVQTRCSLAVVLQELQIYSWRHFPDEPDAIHIAIADIFGAFISTLADKRLEPDL